MQLLVELLLKKNQIPFDKSELGFQIQSHPSYPSLYSITGVLDHFNISNVAARIPETLDALNELPSSFLAQVEQEESSDLCLVEKQGSDCKLTSADGGSSVVSFDTFLHSFTGVVLVVEKTDDAVQTRPSLSYLSKIGLALALAGILYVFLNSVSGILAPLAFFTAIAGVVISVSILQQEFGIKNAIGDAFCTSDSNKNDCNSVLNSKGARIIGDYKLSDLCLIYFSGLSLSIFLLVIQGLSLMPVYVLSLLGLPVTIYSIYYQVVKLKSWCFLCLSIVGILWVQAGLMLGFLSPSFSSYLGLTDFFILVIGFVSSFIVLNYLKPQYEEAQEGRRYKIGYFRFKKDYRIFSALLREQPEVKTNIANIDEIVFGDRESDLEILIITNPFCGHCKPVHSLVEKILERHKNQVKVVIRFNINTSDPTSEVVSITTNLMQIHLTKGQDQGLKAMHEAFHELSANDWIAKWANKKGTNAHFLQAIELQKNWCIENRINFTPEILINGRSMPSGYERQDLMFFIEDLYEALATNLSMEEATYQ